jgi:acyl-CoA hydrolase
MTTQPPHSPETSSGTNLIADSRITMYKVVTSAFVNAQDLLDPGVILMWMDIAACLAAERHTKTSSVTLSMDDLHFDTMVRLGATVRLEATLHKVFGTSMEVGCTVSTSQPSGRDKFVCAACFTFVALGTDGKKMRVAEALAVTPEEKFLSTIATERRAWRLKRSALELEAREGAESSQSLDVAIEEDAVLSGGCAAGGSCCEGGVEEAAPTPLVTYSMTQLVLPNMANHHGNTFGGQVMAWMAEAATVAANRQAFESVPASHLGAISHVEIALVDALQFHAKSVVGDRVVLHATVTRVFGSSMEICVTVEAYGATSTEVRQPQHGLFTARPIHSTTYSQHGLFTTTHATLNPSHAKPSPPLHPGAPSDGH